MITGISALTFLETVKNCLAAAGGGTIDVVKFLHTIHEYDLDIVAFRGTGEQISPSEFGFLNEPSVTDPPFSEG